MIKKLLATCLGALALVAGSYVLADIRPSEGNDGRVALAAASGVDRLDEIDRLIAVFEDRVRTSDDALNQWTLGAHYLDRASLTGDVADYQSAHAILEAAYETNAGNPNVDIPLASARLGLHDFAGAIALLERHLLDPAAVAVYGDAMLAYGEVEPARAAYERLARMAPQDPALTVRLASLKWETGNRMAAIDLAVQAENQARTAGFSGRALAFYQTYHGLLLYESGRFDEALPVLRAAVDLDPGFLPPKIELAHVLAARGDLNGGIALLEEVLSSGPDADSAVVLGDLYTLTGDEDRAEAAYRLLDEAVAEAPDAYRRDLSLFLSNHDRKPELALALAEADLRTRHDSGAFDTLAWALYRSGRLFEAREASDRALEMGTSDAAAFFHAGMISLGLGERDRGSAEIQTALKMNPFFNPLLAEEARSILAALGIQPAG